MKQRCIIIIMFICLMPGVAKAQWTFDILSVEAYINDHKKQRSLLLARSTLEHSNKLLHEYTSDEDLIDRYKETEGNTDEDTIEVQTRTLDLTAVPRPDDGKIKAFTTVDATAYDTFYNAVPVAA